VIARDDDLGLRQSGEKIARLTELLGPGALGQVAGDDDHLRRCLPRDFEERAERPRVDASEVEVGEVEKSPHDAAASAAAGTITRSDRGRTR
jgi:hypothetical protein